MSAVWTPTQAFKDAQLSGGIDGLLDADPTFAAYAILYDAASTPLTTLVFARPAASLVSHELVFAQADLTGDFITMQGSADNFELYNGANVLCGSGSISDMAGDGPLKVSGTTGTLLYAGARAILGALKFKF
jgi:hypothetical protein